MCLKHQLVNFFVEMNTFPVLHLPPKDKKKVPEKSFQAAIDCRR